MYEYRLRYVRELEKGEILPEMLASGLLQPTEYTGWLALPFGVRTVFEENVHQFEPSRPLRVLTLVLDTGQLEDLLTSAPSSFIEWLWSVFERLGIAYAFLGGGSYAAYYDIGRIKPEEVYRQLGRLVLTGEVEFIHPLMFFAERLSEGKTCEIAVEAPGFDTLSRPGVGCLLLLIDGDLESGRIEILDPGIIYPKLKSYFRRRFEELAK